MLLFGLGLSIQCIVVTSNLLSTPLDRHPAIISFRATALGKAGGGMTIPGPLVTEYLQPSVALQYSVEAMFAIGVIVVNKPMDQVRTPRRLIPVCANRAGVIARTDRGMNRKHGDLNYF